MIFYKSERKRLLFRNEPQVGDRQGLDLFQDYVLVVVMVEGKIIWNTEESEGSSPTPRKKTGVFRDPLLDKVSLLKLQKNF